MIGPDGGVLRTGTLGDGILHLLVDERGEIWAGYFDEGIFGSAGWGVPGPQPVGASGLVRFSKKLGSVWQHEGTELWDSISDCYPLNVDGERAWACPYTDFPVIEVAPDGHATVRRTTGVNGPTGLVVAGDRVGFTGAYDDPAALMLGTLDQLDGLTRSSVTLPDGGEARDTARLGSVAHYFHGADWFSFDLAAVV